MPCSIEASNRRPPRWRLTFGTGRPVNRTPDDQGASCCSHEDPHQHGMFTRFLRGYRNYRKAITTVKSVEFHFCGNAKPDSGFRQRRRRQSCQRGLSPWVTLPSIPRHWPWPVTGASGQRYDLDTLIARHGEGFGIPRLLRLLSKDCVKHASVSAYDLCGVHCPELPGFFLSTTD